MNFANILINEGVNKKKIDPKGQIFSDFLASTPGNDETKYLDISFTFHINQPNDIKMFMINGNRANIIFQKKRESLGQYAIMNVSQISQKINHFGEHIYKKMKKYVTYIIKNRFILKRT